MGDLTEAEKSTRLRPIFIAACVNVLIGFAISDPIMWGFARLVILTAIARVLKLD